MSTVAFSAADVNVGEPTGSLRDRVESSLIARHEPARVLAESRSIGATTHSIAGKAGRASWLFHYQASLLVGDLLAGSFAAGVAYLVRFMALGTARTNASSDLYLWCCPILPLLWVGMVAVNRAYEGHLVGFGLDEFQRVLRAFLYLTVSVSFVSYATKTEIARGFIVVALPLTLLTTVVFRYLARIVLRNRRARGHAMSSVLVVGGGRSIADLVEKLRADSGAGMNVIGACVPAGLVDDTMVRSLLADINVPLLGDLDSIQEVVATYGADTVAVTSSQEVGADRLRWISWQLEGTDTDLVVSPGLVEVTGSRLHIRPIMGLPLLHVEQPRFSGLRRMVKGAMDRTVAALALLVLSPVLVSVALLVRATSRGPAFFKQTRIGRDGKSFTMVKFRSMCVDAEQRLDDLSALNEGNGVLFKVRADPRITKVGRILRKFSLDELPQLLNILNGTMSLVGPRPPLPAEVEQYAAHVHRRLLVKPGLTGLWQVSGRSDLSWDESVRLDLRYVENWTPALDLMILWKTLRAVTRSAGAY